MQELNESQGTPRSLILACPCPEEDVSKRGIIEVGILALLKPRLKPH